MFRRLSSFISVLALLTMFGFSHADAKESEAQRVRVPLNIAILIQDDLTSQVANEISTTKEFIRTLPAGSRVMVGYITSGSLQVRQPFTTDLNLAANSLRIPIASTSASAFNPYVEVREALKKFDSSWRNNAVLLISDGLDTSRGFDSSAAGQTLDIDRAIKEANRRNVAIYSFYAPSSTGLTRRSSLAASYGQSSLQRVSDETGGRAFFQGTSGFVTFDSHFRRLREELNRHFAA